MRTKDSDEREFYEIEKQGFINILNSDNGKTS
jgi:hypothetical protein